MFNPKLIPDDCFIDARADIILLVRQEDGVPLYVAEGDTLVPYGEWKNRQPRDFSLGATVSNPPGYAGPPQYDQSAPEYDLNSHGLNPLEYHVHFGTEPPAVVESSTGECVGRIKDGRFVPL